MGKINQILNTWQGNYREIRFLVLDVENLDNCTATWILAATEAGTPIITKTSTSTPAGITFSGKYATVILQPADTASLAAGSYYHELRIVDSAGNPSTPAIGPVTLRGVSITS
jgi:hypothetical protein